MSIFSFSPKIRQGTELLSLINQRVQRHLAGLTLPAEVMVYIESKMKILYIEARLDLVDELDIEHKYSGDGGEKT